MLIQNLTNDAITIKKRYHNVKAICVKKKWFLEVKRKGRSETDDLS